MRFVQSLYAIELQAYAVYALAVLVLPQYDSQAECRPVLSGSCGFATLHANTSQDSLSVITDGLWCTVFLSLTIRNFALIIMQIGTP